METSRPHVFRWLAPLLCAAVAFSAHAQAGRVLTSFQGQTEIAWELMRAGATIQVLPIVILTFLVQKYIVSGLTLGSVK